MTPNGKSIPPRASPSYLGPLANLANVCSYLEGVWFYHRVSQRVPFYHSSVAEKLLTVGIYHRSRALPGMTRFGGEPAFFKKRNRKWPKSAGSDEEERRLEDGEDGSNDLF